MKWFSKFSLDFRTCERWYVCVCVGCVCWQQGLLACASSLRRSQILAAIQYQICAREQGKASLQMLILTLHYVLYFFFLEPYCFQLQRFLLVTYR